ALTPDENEGKDTSCEAGTNICEIITHISNNNTKMITSIRSIKDFKNATQIKLFKSDINNNGEHFQSLEVILEGKDSDNVNQSVNITFFIGHTENSEPIVKEYKDNKLYIEWNIEGPSVTDDDSKGWKYLLASWDICS
ncbi:11813_t:CDS:2, partial [Scutellospora calospora]